MLVKPFNCFNSEFSCFNSQFLLLKFPTFPDSACFTFQFLLVKLPFLCHFTIMHQRPFFFGRHPNFMLRCLLQIILLPLLCGIGSDGLPQLLLRKRVALLQGVSKHYQQLGIYRFLFLLLIMDPKWIQEKINTFRLDSSAKIHCIVRHKKTSVALARPGCAGTMDGRTSC